MKMDPEISNTKGYLRRSTAKAEKYKVKKQTSSVAVTPYYTIRFIH